MAGNSPGLALTTKIKSFATDYGEIVIVAVMQSEELTRILFKPSSIRFGSLFIWVNDREGEEPGGGGLKLIGEAQ